MVSDTKITEELKQEVVKLVAELLQQAFTEFKESLRSGQEVQLPKEPAEQPVPQVQPEDKVVGQPPAEIPADPIVVQPAQAPAPELRVQAPAPPPQPVMVPQPVQPGTQVVESRAIPEPVPVAAPASVPVVQAPSQPTVQEVPLVPPAAVERVAAPVPVQQPQPAPAQQVPQVAPPAPVQPQQTPVRIDSQPPVQTEQKPVVVEPAATPVPQAPVAVLQPQPIPQPSIPQVQARAEPPIVEVRQERQAAGSPLPQQPQAPVQQQAQVPQQPVQQVQVQQPAQATVQAIPLTPPAEAERQTAGAELAPMPAPAAVSPQIPGPARRPQETADEETIRLITELEARNAASGIQNTPFVNEWAWQSHPNATPSLPDEPQAPQPQPVVQPPPAEPRPAAVPVVPEPPVQKPATQPHIEDVFRDEERRQQQFVLPTPQELVTQRAQEKAEQRRDRMRDRGQTPHIDRFKEGVEERQYEPPATPPRREPKTADPVVQLEPGIPPSAPAEQPQTGRTEPKPDTVLHLPEVESVDAFNVVTYPQKERDQRTGNFETEIGKLQGSSDRAIDAVHSLFRTITTFMDRLADNSRTAKRNVEQLDSEQAREVKL